MTNQEIPISSKVKLITLPPYLKTADPMPMLRPADILKLGEEGMVLDRRPGGYWVVRFERGAFLLESQYMEVISSPIELEVTEDIAPEDGDHCIEDL